jgi:CMP-2-keto-3-deoxyoctulosonic acid synthetase
MTSTAILIPARYASTRFPGKPLCDLGGMPMIKRVYETCARTGIDTYVLTDDMRIARLFNWNNCWIEETEYENGTERCAGAVSNKMFSKYNKFINVQGDMPDVTVDMIEKCITGLLSYTVSTVFADLPTELQNDPSSVKMIRAGDKALWFGRGMTGYGNWHLGVYGYKRHALEMYQSLSVPIEEEVEKLEQLRWLKAGWDIGCLHTEFTGIEINTPDDLEKWNEH